MFKNNTGLKTSFSDLDAINKNHDINDDERKASNTDRTILIKNKNGINKISKQIT